VEKIKVGCMMPLSGAEHRHARSQLLAVRLAFEEREPANVELVVEDEEFSPQLAIEIARAFAADEQVLAVIGPMNSNTSIAAAPVFADAGLVHIATAASNPGLTQRGWPTFFRVVVNDIHHYRAAAQYAVHGLGARRIGAIFSAGGTFSTPMAEGFREVARSLGAEVPLFLPIDGAGSDYSTDVAQVLAAPVDLLFFVVGEETAVRIAVQLREAGVRTPFFATDGIKPLPYFATPDYDVDGPYYTNVCADPRVSPAAGAMVQRYIARFGEEPTVYMAEAYDAAGIILEAIERAAASGLTRASVRDAVAATRSYEGASGTITFDEAGDIVTPAIGIYKYKNGGLTFLGFARDLLPAETTA
jgi:branched-chain amino acid transport system substrate-binding protein